MLHCTILKKYWDREELKGLNFKRALKIIEILEIWEGEGNVWIQRSISKRHT